MLGNKGQGAMEYLMTYGWAILVVMIVGIVMWQLGIFSMGTTTVTATGFSKIKPQLAGSGLTAGGAFTGVFTNGVGTSINVDTTAAGPTAITDILTNTSCATVTLSQGTNPITAGSNFVISGGTCGTGVAGDVYTVRVRLNYSVAIGTVSTDHLETGTIRGPRE